MTTQEAGFVVVGVDGSKDSLAALAWAEGFARATGARLRIVVTWMWPTAYGYPMMFDGFDPSGEARRIADEAASRLDLPKEQIETRTVEGPAGKALVHESADAMTLVVGHHGHRPAADNLLLGSVASYCLHHAAIPTVVVPSR